MIRNYNSSENFKQDMLHFDIKSIDNVFNAIIQENIRKEIINKNYSLFEELIKLEEYQKFEWLWTRALEFGLYIDVLEFNNYQLFITAWKENNIRIISFLLDQALSGIDRETQDQQISNMILTILNSNQNYSDTIFNNYYPFP